MKSWMDAQLGAHDPSSKPREKAALDGLDCPLERSLLLPRRADGMGLAPRLVSGLRPGVKVGVFGASLLPGTLLPRDLIVVPSSTPAGTKPVVGLSLVWFDVPPVSAMF